MLWIFGCFSNSEVQAELNFVRDGILLADVAEKDIGTGKKLGDARFYEEDWTSGEVFNLNGIKGTAPKIPECRSVYSYELGDVSQMISLGAGPPNTSVSWSHSGDLLAVGRLKKLERKVQT